MQAVANSGIRRGTGAVVPARGKNWYWCMVAYGGLPRPTLAYSDVRCGHSLLLHVRRVVDGWTAVHSSNHNLPKGALAEGGGS